MYQRSHHCSQTPRAPNIIPPPMYKQGLRHRRHSVHGINVPSHLPPHMLFRRQTPLRHNQQYHQRLPYAIPRIQTLLPVLHLTPRAPHCPNNTRRQAVRPRFRYEQQLITLHQCLGLQICPRLQPRDLPHCPGVHRARGIRCLLHLHLMLPARKNTVHRPHSSELCRDVLSTFRTQ